MTNIKNIIESVINNFLFEQRLNIRYLISSDEDNVTITARINNNIIGKIVFEEMIDSYEYEFSDVFTYDEFYSIFKDDNITKIDYIDVNDNYKNKGIGTELMKIGLNYMKKRGDTQFYLNASPMGFSGLRLMDLVEFYKAFGFFEIKHQGGNILMAMIL